MLRLESVVQPLYRTIGDVCRVINRCRDDREDLFTENWESLEYLEDEFLPSGSGLNSGCTVRDEESGPEKIVLDVTYEYSEEGVYMEDWDLVLTVSPTLDVREFTVDLDVDNDTEYCDEMIADDVIMPIIDALREPAPRYVRRWRELGTPGTGRYGQKDRRRMNQIALAVEDATDMLSDKIRVMVNRRAKDAGLELDHSPEPTREINDEYSWTWSMCPSGEDWGMNLELTLSESEVRGEGEDDGMQAAGELPDVPKVGFDLICTNDSGEVVVGYAARYFIRGEDVRLVDINDNHRLELWWDTIESDFTLDLVCDEIIRFIKNRKEDDDS